MQNMLVNGKYYLWIVLSLIIAACNSESEKKSPVNNHQVSAKSELEELEDKVMTDSLNTELRSILAMRLYSAGELEKAAYHYIIIYKIDSLNFNALLNLGNIYYDHQQDDKAIDFYEKALKIEPENINIRCDLATCYSNVSNYKMAIRILKQNIKIDPNHAKSHYNLAVIYKRSGDLKEAESEMKIFEALNISIK